MVSKIRPFASNNVVGDAAGLAMRSLKDEAVMYTAHYDHLGIRPDMPGDNIYNGAMDNATGCGILLEMARVFGAAAQKPRRSILFAAVTAEEQGLLGSEYLGKHPPIPAGKISLDLNYDDVPPLGSPEEVEVSGAERTTFYPAVEATAKDFRLTIRPDARPEAGHYYRSDHFSLARVGIPSFSVNEGMKYKGHDEAWGIASRMRITPTITTTSRAMNIIRGWITPPTLRWRDSASRSAGRLRARRTRVDWKKGDEFEKAQACEQYSRVRRYSVLC